MPDTTETTITEFVIELRQALDEREEGRIDSKEFLMRIRQALIIALGAIEDALGLERSIVPRHKR